MKLSVIMPVYNEKDRHWPVFHAIQKLRSDFLAGRSDCDIELIIVDDGSTDMTRGWRLAQSPHLQIFHHATNLGKGTAIRTGLKYATGDLVIIQDADGELDPADIPKLVQAWENAQGMPEGDWDVVYGARPKEKLSWGARLMNWMTNIYLSTEIDDVSCGYKLIPTGLLRFLDTQSNGFPWCFEVTAKLKSIGVKIQSVPVSYHSRKEGKKLKWWDGFGCQWALLKYRTV